MQMRTRDWGNLEYRSPPGGIAFPTSGHGEEKRRPGRTPLEVEWMAPGYLTRTLGSTDMPGRSMWFRSSLGLVKSIRTGMRWTTLT